MDLDEDVINAGSQAWQQLVQLVNQAISCPTTRDKDQIIYNMMSNWQIAKGAQEYLTTTLSSMQDVLDLLQSKESTAINSKSVLEANTTFMDIYRVNRSEIEAQAKIIRDIEREITSFRPVESPGLANKYLQDSDDVPREVQGIRLKDLTFKRLEELVIALKKQSLLIDDSDDLILTVNDNYGSMRGLMDTYGDLKIENERLKEEESKVAGDYIIKRRGYSKLAHSQLARMVLLMEKELIMQNDIGDSMTQKPQYAKGDLDLDAITQNKSIMTYTSREFATTTNPENVSQICGNCSVDEKLHLMEEIIEEHKRTVSKLMDSINDMRTKKYDVHGEMSERERRLWQLQEKFSAQIVDLMTKIDETYEETDSLADAIADGINETRAYGQKTGQIYHDFTDLANSHVLVNGLVHQNFTVTEALSHASMVFGKNLMKNEHQNEDLEMFMKNKAELFKPKETEELHKVKPPEDPPSEQLESPREPNYEHPSARGTPRLRRLQSIDVIKGFQSSSVRKKRHRADSIFKESFDHRERESDSQQSKRNPIENGTPTQIIDYLALAYDLSQRTCWRKETRYHEVISKSLHDILNTLTSELESSLNTYKEERENMVEYCQMAENLVLRKEKVEMGIQNGLGCRSDAEGQTEEEEPEVKGKGKGAKPKGKPGKRK